MTFVAAAVQFEPTLGRRDENVERLIALSRSATDRGASLVVLPEMATTGYCWTGRDEVAPFVEPVSGPTTDAFHDVARESGAWIVVGMPEVDPRTGAFYNSSVLIGPGGVEGVYRKSHPYVTEVRWARDGDLGIPVFETPLGRLGMLICMDAEYLEPARLLALAECDVVCFPTNWLGEPSPSAYWITRAWENGAYWVASNRHGVERGVQFSGGSAVIGPDGSVLDRIDAGEGIAIGEIDPSLAAKERAERLTGRRPRLWQALGRNGYLWPSALSLEPDDGSALYGLGRPVVRSDVEMAVFDAQGGGADPEAVAHWLQDRSPAPGLVVLPFRRDLDLLAGAAFLDGLGEVSARFGPIIVVGVPWHEEGRAYDAAVLLSPDGSRAIHRSTWPSLREGVDQGDREPPILDMPFGRLTLLCGDEILQPEPMRDVAARGAEVVAVPADLDAPAPVGLDGTAVPMPAGSPSGPDPVHWLLPRVRAAENNVWVCFANAGRIPSAVFGPSFYRWPRTETLAEAGQAASLRLPGAPSDPERQTATEKPYLRMRLPHMYGPLLQPVDERP